MRIIWTFFDILGIAGEEVDAESTADEEELLGVDGGFVEQFLEGARGDADAVGEPLVGVARAAQLVADNVADVYLHSGCCCALDYRIPIYTPTAADKKEGEQFRLQSAAVESTFRNRQNARLSASICTLSFLIDLD